ncbi:T9SS type A sorting domain-containing protein [Rubrivirga marina]|uniref:Secretion system C-terminal sorting domain-containing protein n=1 Tax=Rubrivirga marina TaxID=1196024 RepID=A0A271IVS6_9BACT|nr:T9SS type A sorting domain-containing protein [Rubrivirga marina]PAP75028.1 hypothetical protein BSZ37_00450 [Rubrivirga marina]
MIRSFLILLALVGVSTAATGQPDPTCGLFVQPPCAVMDGVEVERVANIPGGQSDERPIRIDRDPTDGTLYVLATSQPDGRTPGSTSTIYRLVPNEGGTFDPVAVTTHEEHGAPRAIGMTFGPEGNLYLVGNDEVGDTQTRIVIRRGTPNGDGWDWATVATTEPYLLSYTYFDHRANGAVVTPDGSTLIVNSGSRTDHGESYGGVREEALTAVLLKVPTDGTDIVLPNDRQALKEAGYVYAEGNRNTFDLAFAPNGDLIGPDNAGDRDDPGELNWYREGEHYGFPWRIGGNDTPMQFSPYGAPYGYDGPNDDPLVPEVCNPNPADTGCYFSNDPGYPAPPEGVTFVEPIPNVGPYADKFIDPVTGAVRDASEEGVSVTSFSGGRSPQGIVFDTEMALAGRLQGGGFLLGFAGARGGFPSDGRDLVFIDLDKGEEGYTVSTEAVAVDFVFPIDAVMADGVIYVAEYGRWFASQPIRDSRGVFAVRLPRDGVSTEPGVRGPYLDAFPNPTAGNLTLEYSVPQAAEVRVELVDALGRVVRTAERPANAGRLDVSTDGLSAGVYVVRLTAGDVRRSRTVTVLR